MVLNLNSTGSEPPRKRRLWAWRILKKHHSYIKKISIMVFNLKIFSLKTSTRIFLYLIIFSSIFIGFYPKYLQALISKDFMINNDFSSGFDSKVIIYMNNGLSSIPAINFEIAKPNKLINLKIASKDKEDKNYKHVWVTAYSSSFDETDDTPFITASGVLTMDGIVATNFLPFKTKIKIPSLFGNKVFVVEDRMHPRKSNFIDIWMPSKEAALNFGIHYTQIIILDSEKEFAQKYN